MGGLAFTFLYLTHRLLQGAGPDTSGAAAVAAYQVAHRGALLAWVLEVRSNPSGTPSEPTASNDKADPDSA